MVEIRRLDGTALYLNAELVETVEATPDTVIALVNGHRYIVQQSAEEIIDSICAYRRRLAAPRWSQAASGS